MSEFVLFYLGDAGWSGAYEGDITFEHIEELRELVNAPVSDEVADSFFIGTIRQDPAAYDAGILAQLTFAMRIFDHDVDISYSTRESAEIRNNMATLGVTTMSAESKTEPGGYYSYPQTLEQFHVSDERKAVEVERDLKKLGREPIWKDWDQSFDFKR